MSCALDCADFPPIFRDGFVGDWFVLRSKSRQEKRIAEFCASMGVASYLPLVTHVRYYGKRKASVTLPVFSGYLFVRGLIEQVYGVDRRRHLASIIRVSDQQRITSELANLHRVISRQGRLEPYPYLHEGMRVEVKSGPFRGVQGIVSELKRDRLILQVKSLGQAVSLEIDGSLLEPVADAVSQCDQFDSATDRASSTPILLASADAERYVTTA